MKLTERLKTVIETRMNPKDAMAKLRDKTEPLNPNYAPERTEDLFAGNVEERNFCVHIRYSRIHHKNRFLALAYGELEGDGPTKIKVKIKLRSDYKWMISLVLLIYIIVAAFTVTSLWSLAAAVVAAVAIVAVCALSLFHEAEKLARLLKSVFEN